MNLVGKILTVLIFVMSLVFMSFAVAVYATHKNWKEAAAELKVNRDNLEARNRELRDQRDKIEAELSAEKKARDQAIGKLESHLDALRAKHASLEEQNAKTDQERRQAVAAMNAIQQTLKSLRAEVGKLRSDVTMAQEDREAHFKKVVALTDELHQLVNERERLKQRTLTLIPDLQKAKDVLRQHGLDKEQVGDVPPQVDGEITAVPRPGLVEINLGSDDGLRNGHKLEVFRSRGGVNKYVGRVVVIKTSYDKAACKADPNFQKSPIQRGDRVTTKLQ